MGSHGAIPRKMEHVDHTLQLGQSGNQGFSDIKLIHNCLPETSLGLISLHTQIGELKLSSPIIINAMTGGAQETGEINRELAVAARTAQWCGVRGIDIQVMRNVQGLINSSLGSHTKSRCR